MVPIAQMSGHCLPVTFYPLFSGFVISVRDKRTYLLIAQLVTHSFRYMKIPNIAISGHVLYA